MKDEEQHESVGSDSSSIHPSSFNLHPFLPWLIVALLWVVAMLNYLDRLTITTMRDSIKADIAMTDAQFGLLTSVFLWVYAFLSPAAGFLADRFSRSRVIIASLFVWSLLTALTGHCHTVNQLIIVRALMGISEACYIPAALALIADYHPGPTRSLATGIHMSGLYAGVALGGLGGYVAEGFGWRAGFTLFGATGMAYGILLLLLLRDAPKSTTSTPSTSSTTSITMPAAFRSLLTQPSYYAVLVYWTLLSIAGWGITGWLPTYLKEHFHMGQGAAGISATGYIQAASFIGILVGGAWADIWSRANIRGRLLVPVIGFILAAPALYMSSSTTIFTAAIIGLIIYGLARGFADANMMPILCQVADPRYRATAYGIINCASCLAGGIIIYAGGALRDHQIDLATTFQYSALGLFLAAIILLQVRPRQFN